VPVGDSVGVSVGVDVNATVGVGVSVIISVGDAVDVAVGVEVAISAAAISWPTPQCDVFRYPAFVGSAQLRMPTRAPLVASFTWKSRPWKVFIPPSVSRLIDASTM